MKPHLSFRFLFILAIMLLIPMLIQGTVLAEDSEQQSTFASPILVVNTSFLNIRSGPSASYSIVATVVGGTELPVLAVYEDQVWYQVATNIGIGWVNIEFTLPRGDFSRVPMIDYGSIVPVSPPVVSVANVANLGQGGGGVAQTTSVGTSASTGIVGVSFMGGDLHTGPSGSSPIVAAVVGGNDNQIFPVINIAYEDGRPYYQVNFPGYGIVWGDRYRLRPLECNGLSVIVATEFVGTTAIGVSPPIEFSPGDEMYIAGAGRDGLIEIMTADGTRGMIPVDKTRGRDASVVNYCDGVNPVSGGTTVATAPTTVINPGQGGGGLPVVVPALAATSGARLVVNTGNLNIRTGPSASYSVLATVPGGTELPVTGMYEDEVWYQVATNIGIGWVNIEFTLPRGDFSRVPLIEYGTITTAVNQPVVSVANLGQGGGGVAQTTSVGASASTGIVGVSFMGGDLHTGPSGSSPIVAAVVGGNDNQIFPVINIAYEDGRPYYQVNFPGYGIVWGDRFRLRPLECNGLSVIVATEFVGTTAIGVSPPIEFSPGDEMYIAGAGRDGLIEIMTADGTRGMIPVDKTRGRDASIVNYCDGVNPVSGGTTVATAPTTVINPGQGGGGLPVVVPALAATSGARLVVNTGNLNIRTGPSASYSVLATVPGGVELPVTAVYEDKVWYQVATSLGVGWVNVEFTLARGDFSRVPLIEYGTLNTTNLGQGGGVAQTTTVTLATGVVTTTAPTSAARVVINTPNLNIRTGPSASFSIVATVSGGTELTVLGVADDGVWYLVEGTFGQGWLNNEFVIFRGDYSAVPVLNINP